MCWTLQWILSLPSRTLLSLVWQVSLFFDESDLDFTLDFGTCVARACCTHVQPSPSGTHHFDSTASPGLVNAQIFITDVEAYAPQVVGSFLPFEEFVAPMCNKSLHQYGHMFFFKKFKWMCWHLQLLMLRPVNSYLRSLMPSLLTSTSFYRFGVPAIFLHCYRDLCVTDLWFTFSLVRVCCTHVQPSPSGTDRCRRDDPEHS